MDFWKLSTPIRVVLASVLSLLLACSSVSTQALAEAMDEANASSSALVSQSSQEQANTEDAQNNAANNASAASTNGTAAEETATENEPQRWSIVLNANGGTLRKDAKAEDATMESVEDGDAITLPSIHEREGYVLAGWSTMADPAAWQEAREEELAQDPSAPEPDDAPLFVPAAARLYNLTYSYVTLDDGTVRQVSDLVAAQGHDSEGREVRTCDLHDRVRDGKLTLYAQWKQAAQEAASSDDATQDGSQAPANAGANAGTPKDTLTQTSEQPAATTTSAQQTQSGSSQVSEDTGGIDPNAELPASAEPAPASPTGMAALLADPDVVLDSSKGDPQAAAALDKAEQDVLKRNLLASPLQTRGTTNTLLPQSAGSVTDDRAPKTKDGTTVEAFRLVWNTHDSASVADGVESNLYLAPDDDTPLDMQASMQFAFSGEKNYPAGTIQITVPAQVCTNREGELIGSMTFGVPEEPDTSQSFAYRLVTPTDGTAPYCVITNTRALQSGTTGVIQLSIHGIVPHEIKSDTKTISDEISSKLQAELTLTTARGNDIVVGTNPLTAQIHTSEKIDNAYKNGGRVVDAKDAKDPIKSALNNLPGGADNYVLVRWNTYANVEGNQAFQFDMTDTIGTIKVNGQPVSNEGSVVLGTSTAAATESGSTYTKTVLPNKSYLESGESRYENVWTAYPKSLFDEGINYEITNDVTWTVTPTDNGEVTHKDASARIFYHKPSPVAFVAAPGHYVIEKETLEPHRYPTSTNTALTDLKGLGTGADAVAPKDTTIGFTVSAYGEIMERTMLEGVSFASVTDPATDPNLHQRYVTMEATDDAIYLNGNYTSELTSADYYISRVHLHDPSVYTYGHVGGDVNNEWDYIRNYEASPLPAVALWGLSESEGGTAQEWTKLATMTHDEHNAHHVTSAIDGVTVNGLNVNIAESLGITRVKVVSSAKDYDAMRLQYNPYITLRADGPRVQALISQLFAQSDSPTASMRNDVTLAAYNGDGVNGTYGSEDANAPTVDPADASLVSGQGDGIFAIPGDPNQSVGFSRTLAMDTSRYGRPMWHYASHAYLRGAVPRIGVTSTKTMKYDPTTDLNKSTMQATLHYTTTVHEQSNVLSKELYEEYVQNRAIDPETSGTWYDLLPLGVHPDLSTVRLRDQDSVLDAYTIENYQGTGRTMLVVQAELVPQLKYNDVVEGATAGEGYWSQGIYDELKLSFDAVYSYEDFEATVDEHGDPVDKLVNLIAFESGNDVLGNQEGMMGEYDDATGGTGDTKVYRNKETAPAVADTPDLTDGRAAQVMSNLDSSLGTDNKKPTFVYARADTNITVDRNSVSSISKTVASDAEGIYRTGTSDTDAQQGWAHHDNQVNVYEGHGYNYRIEVAHGSGETSNIVLYDSLENYQLNEGNSDNTIGAYRWHGEFVSVDVSHIKAAGVAPVVYYSTTANLSFDKGTVTGSGSGYVDINDIQNTNLSDTSVWTPASSYTGLPSAVKAIAIDCSKKTNGEDFVLPAGSSLIAYIHMKAPTEVVTGGASNLFKTIHPNGSEDEPNDNSHAFNNVYISSAVKGPSDTNAQTMFYHPDYVKVGIVPFKLHVSKIWDDANNNDGKRPDHVTVHLLANGQTAKYENGTDVAAVTLNNGNGWTHSFEDVPYVDTNNKPIHYTVTEDPITEKLGDGTTVRLYAPSYLHTDDAHLQIVNKRAPETVDVCGTKTWEDNGDAAGARPSTIRVRLYADGAYKTEKYVGEATDGSWSYAFTDLPAYKDGNKIVYTVEEDPIPFYAHDYAASTDGSGSVVAADGTVQGSTNITNTYSTTGLLGIGKTTEGVISEAGRNAVFTFKVELFSDQKDDNGHDVPLADAYPYYVIDAATGNKVEGSDGTVSTGGTVSCKGGQRVIIAGIPVGSTYRVTEQPTAGFYQSASANTTGTITAGVNANHAVVASFTNTYKSSGSFQLKATKKLQNQQLALYGFRFQAYQVFNEGTGDEYEQVVRSVSNGAGGPMDANGVSTGEVTFARVNVTSEDLGSDGQLTLLYRIREVKVDGQEGIYNYATNVEQVRVTLTDAGDGTITATQTPETTSGTSHIRSLDGTTTDSAFVSNGDATFTNTYTAGGTLELTALKVLKGRALTADEFEFGLTPLTAGAPTAATMTARNDANGVVRFPAITLAGEHGGKSFIYRISENAGTDDGVQYSTQAIYYRVDVTDDGKGAMSSTQTVVTPKAGASEAAIAAGNLDAFEPTETSPTITNTLKPGSLQIKKQLASDSTGHEDQEFTFRVRLTGDGLAEKYTYTVSGTSTPVEAQVQDGVFEVKIKPGQTATIEGIPAGTTYAVFEDAVAGWQVESQSNTSGTIAPLGTSEASFTNQYVPGQAKAQLFATKTLDGASASKKFGFVLRANDSAPMPEGATEGTVTAYNSTTTGLVDFGSIAYDAPGTYTYTITETPGIANDAADNTIEYDATEWTATVTVTNTGTAESPVLSAVVSYSNGADESTSTPLSFANTTKPGELTVKKEGQNITPKNKDAVFDFTVQLQNDGQPVDKASYYITDADGNVVKEPTDTQSAGGMNPATGLSTLLSGARDALLHLFVPRVAYAEEPPTSGTFGNGGSCTWEWDAGTITVRATNPGTLGEWKNLGSTRPWTTDVNITDIKRFVVDVSTTNTPVKVSGNTSFASMFVGYTNLEYVDMSGLDASGYQDNLDSSDSADRSVMHMFEGCGSLQEVKLPAFTGYAVAPNYMFRNCTSLTSVSMPHMNIRNGDQGDGNFYMFANCSNLQSIDLSGLHISQPCWLSNMFNGCSALTKVTMGISGAENITRTERMFEGCTSLVDADLSKLVYTVGKTPALSSVDHMFQGCIKLKTLNYSGFNTSQVSNMSYMFSGCTSLTALDLSGFDASSVTTYQGIFRRCKNLETLDMSGLSTAKGPNVSSFFYNSLDNDEVGGANLKKLVIGDKWTKAYENSSTTRLPAANWVKVEDAAMGSAIVLTSDELMGRTNTAYNQAHPDDYKGTWVRAVDTASKYVVTYNPMGAYYAAGEPPTALPGSATQNVGEPVTLPTPKWNDDSKTFVAWRTEYNAETGQYLGDSFAAGTRVDNVRLGLGEGKGGYKTLFAEWADNTTTAGTVEIYLQDGLSENYVRQSSTPIEFDSTGVVKVPAAPDGFVYNPEKFEYTGGGTHTYDATASTYTVTPKNGATLRFYYNRQAYTVNFDANYDTGATDDTSGTMGPMPVAVGSAKKLPANAFAWEGHTFVGWNTVKTPTTENPGTTYTDQAQIKNLAANGGTVTLYAQWIAGSSSSSSTGTYTFKLKPGQTVHFANVPAGTRYSVVESSVLPNGWTQTATTDTTGTVPANAAANAVVTNTYDATGVVSLQAKKTMWTGSLAEGQFDFQLWDMTGVAEGQEGRLLQTVSNLAPAEGTATADILFDPIDYQLSSLMSGGTYADKTYTYEIREVVPQNANDGVIYGANAQPGQTTTVKTVTVDVADAGTGKLTATPSNVITTGEGVDTVTTVITEFVNDYEPGSLEVSKTTTGTTEASANKKFTFSVKLTDARGNPVSRSYDLVRIAADGTETTTTGGASFIDGTAAISDVGSGESFRIEGIAKDATYEVSEFVIPDGFKQTAASGTTGTIEAGKKSQASFTNAYEATGAVALKATKTLADGNIADYTFTFQLYDEANKLLQTKTNNASGMVTFDELGFSTIDAGTRDAPKTYTYKIAEVNDAQKNVAYDTHSGWLDVKVWDEEGTGQLTVQAVYDHKVGDPNTTPETFANKVLHPIEMPTTGGSGLAIPVAVAVIAATAEATRRMRRRAREDG